MKSSKSLWQCWLLFGTYLIVGHESPREDTNFLNKGDLVNRAWQVCLLGVDYVLKVLHDAAVEWIQVHFAVHYAQQPKVFVNGQIGKDVLCEGLLLLLAL